MGGHFTEMCCGTEAGSYLRLIDSCITQLIRLKDLLGPVTRVKKKGGHHHRVGGLAVSVHVFIFENVPDVLSEVPADPPASALSAAAQPHAEHDHWSAKHGRTARRIGGGGGGAGAGGAGNYGSTMEDPPGCSFKNLLTSNTCRGPRKGERRVVQAKETAQNGTERCRGGARGGLGILRRRPGRLSRRLGATHGLQKSWESAARWGTLQQGEMAANVRSRRGWSTSPSLTTHASVSLSCFLISSQLYTLTLAASFSRGGMGLSLRRFTGATLRTSSPYAPLNQLRNTAHPGVALAPSPCHPDSPHVPPKLVEVSSHAMLVKRLTDAGKRALARAQTAGQSLRACCCSRPRVPACRPGPPLPRESDFEAFGTTHS